MFPSYNQALSLQQSALEHHAALKFPGPCVITIITAISIRKLANPYLFSFFKNSAPYTDISQVGPSHSLILYTTLATNVFICSASNTGIMPHASLSLYFSPI